MTLSLKHTFTSAKTDGSDATLIQPSAWNSEHTITLDATTIVGNVSGSTAAASALTPAQGRYVLNAVSSEAASYLGFCVNPFMEISQENGATSGSALGAFRYGVDQYYSFFLTASTGTATNQQITDPFSGTTNYRRFRSALKLTIGTAQSSLAAGDYLLCSGQNIEGNFIKGLGFGTADAASIDIVAIVSASVTGTYSLSLRNGASNRSYVTPISLTANTPTVVFVTIPGDTAGTWTTDNTAGFVLWICGGAGSTFQTPANNSWQTGNLIGVVGGGINLAATASASLTVAYFNIFPTGVLPYTTAAQVDLTHLANMRRPYDDELRRCQRYLPCWNVAGRIAGGGYVQNTTVGWFTILFPVPTRVAPTGFTVGTVGNMLMGVDGQIGATALSSLAINGQASTTAARLSATASAANFTAGQVGQLDMGTTTMFFTGARM